jgi:hypothetical protein
MTASQFASLLGGRRWRKGQNLRCPAHPDKHPSLSVKDGDKGVIVYCQSNHCTTKEICAAIGISVSDLFYDKITPQVRAPMREFHDQAREQYLNSRLLGDLEPGKRNYWRAIQRRAWKDWQWARLRLEPVEVIREWREVIWAEMSQDEKDRYLEGVWERLQR